MTPMNPQGPPKKSNTVLIVVLAVGGLCMLCCVGTIAAIAVPNFLKFGARSKQSEVKSNLKAVFTAEKYWFMEKDTYSESIEDIGFAPERGNRYRYILSPSGDALNPGEPAGGKHTGVLVDAKMGPAPDDAALLARIPPPLLAQAGLKGECPKACHITILAVADLDKDSTVDLWSISTEDRMIDGVSVPAGTPHKHSDDVND